MAEFGELLPGTKWRAMHGRKVTIGEHPILLLREDGTSSMLSHHHWPNSEYYAGWVPWVEPIAVGDTVTIGWAEPYPFEVCATFERNGEQRATVQGVGGFFTVLVSECRKVNDE